MTIQVLRYIFTRPIGVQLKIAASNSVYEDRSYAPRKWQPYGNKPLCPGVLPCTRYDTSQLCDRTEQKASQQPGRLLRSLLIDQNQYRYMNIDNHQDAWLLPKQTGK